MTIAPTDTVRGTACAALHVGDSRRQPCCGDGKTEGLAGAREIAHAPTFLRTAARGFARLTDDIHRALPSQRLALCTYGFLVDQGGDLVAVRAAQSRDCKRS
jgi:hypothetical protein